MLIAIICMTINHQLKFYDHNNSTCGKRFDGLVTPKLSFSVLTQRKHSILQKPNTTQLFMLKKHLWESEAWLWQHHNEMVGVITAMNVHYTSCSTTVILWQIGYFKMQPVEFIPKNADASKQLPWTWCVYPIIVHIPKFVTQLVNQFVNLQKWLWLAMVCILTQAIPIFKQNKSVIHLISSWQTRTHYIVSCSQQIYGININQYTNSQDHTIVSCLCVVITGIDEDFLHSSLF